MADRTSMVTEIRNAPAHIIRHILTWENVGGEDSERNTTGVWIEGHDVNCGSADEVAAALRSLIEDGVEDAECPVCEGEGVREHVEGNCLTCAGDGVVSYPPAEFAFKVYESPKYEWLGDLHVHVPDVGDFQADCSEMGMACVDPDALVAAVNNATTLEGARAAIADLTGTRIEAAFDALPGVERFAPAA